MLTSEEAAGTTESTKERTSKSELKTHRTFHPFQQLLFRNTYILLIISPIYIMYIYIYYIYIYIIYISNNINEVIKTVLSSLFFFLQKRFYKYKKAQNRLQRTKNKKMRIKSI